MRKESVTLIIAVHSSQIFIISILFRCPKVFRRIVLWTEFPRQLLLGTLGHHYDNQSRQANEVNRPLGFRAPLAKSRFDSFNDFHKLPPICAQVGIQTVLKSGNGDRGGGWSKTRQRHPCCSKNHSPPVTRGDPNFICCFTDSPSG